MERNPAEVATLAQLACLLEVSASKPGNVAPGRRFRDMGYEDFLVSALAIGPALAAAGSAPLGTTIRSALEATRRRTRANTNLGMVLLLAPIARAALRPAEAADLPLRTRLRLVLSETTVEDAVEAYAAIREAAPGGMGRSEAQDLSTRPTVTLTEAMRLAAGRDAVAREYVTEFALTFECGLPALTEALAAGLDWGAATVQTFLAILARSPDTLIARKLGNEEAQAVSRRAAEVQAAGGVGSQAGREALAQFDAALRDRQNSFNPGTTADLTAAALFVALLERGGP